MYVYLWHRTWNGAFSRRSWLETGYGAHPSYATAFRLDQSFHLADELWETIWLDHDYM